MNNHNSELIKWRHHLHMYPELGMKEKKTSAFVAEKLRSFGLNVHTGIGGTGVIGVLKSGKSKKTVGLRADMDALPMQEENTFPHKSKSPGVMHACGHDGHVAMLLGAAKMLSETKAFDGTVYFIFQPGEEGCGGAMAMINDGLFKKFKIDCVFGMHAGGGFRTGEFSTRPGPLLAGNARFRIRIIGKEAHAASPHRGIDALIVGSQVVLALQTIVSRLNRPIDPVVISVVEFKSGNGSNVIPGEAILSGTIRTFGHKVMTNVTRDIAKIAKGISKIYGATADVEIVSGTSALVNSKNETGRAILAAQDVVGEQKVEVDGEQFMGSDDFACLLEKCPGCYIHLGNGVDSIGIHTPKYDFHDENLATGVKYWEALVKRVLPRK